MRQTSIGNFDLKLDERARRRWKDDVKTVFRNRVSAWCVLRRVITLRLLRGVITVRSAKGDNTASSAKGNNTVRSAKGNNTVFCEG